MTTATLDLLIVGAGFAGTAMLHKARSSGLTALAVEAAPSVGGTWYANRYPGARVDIQSLEYSYAFDEGLQQSWHWSERYASQPELLRYANHVADRFDLRRDIRLTTRVTAMVYDEAARQWQVDGVDADGVGQAWRARFVVLASGPLSTPNTPAFAGLGDFAGAVLHTADWPHAPVDFRGRHVGVIGTGSSGVQVIPQIAVQAASVTVFQRTAAYVVPAHNGPLDPVQEARVKADYAGFRARNRQMRTGFGCELPINPDSALTASPEERAAAFEMRWQVGGFGMLGAFGDVMTDLRANEHAAEFVRGKIRAAVHDSAVAARLSPNHPIGCKRLCVADGYYETYNRPNVRLVDVSTQPIEAVTQGGLRAGGHEHAFDTLVLATGFDAVTGTVMRLDLRGRDGLRIQDKWRGGPLNYLGLTVAGFPNLFQIAGAGSPAAFTSVILTIEHHVDWIADCIGWLAAHGHATIEATDAAESDWIGFVNFVARQTVFLNCNSWYLGANIPGKPRMFMPLAGGYPLYAQRCAEVVDAGYSGFAFG
ncbi:MAG: NAD(P)/FAD-dependent oxidoreductase [Burkholderiaceae bacterium]